MMNLKRAFTWASLVIGSAAAITVAPSNASALSLSGINGVQTGWSSAYTAGGMGQISTHDIDLKSVTAGGITFKASSLSLINKANIIYNDAYTGGDTGAASSDKGDFASGVKLEDATNESIVASLGNLNLNNIIDTEDTGKFTIDVWFDRPVDRLFFWERGMNSKLIVQALDDAGNALSEILLNSENSTQTGFDLNTTEVSGQKVGALGVSLNGGLAQRFRLIANRDFNGPDFKVVGAAVPEPMTMAGTALAIGGVTAARRKKRKQEAEAAGA